MFACVLDVQALGCLFYQLCFGVSPFEESGKLGTVNGKYRLPEESQFTVFYPLIRKLTGSLSSYLI